MNVYIATIIMAVFAMLVQISLVLKNSALAKNVKTGIILSSVMIIVGASSECLGVVFNGSDPVWRIPHMLVKFMELSVAPAIPVAFAAAFNRIKPLRFFSIILVVHAVAEFLSMFLGTIFYVDADNVYHHCKFYVIYYVMYFVGILFLIVQIVNFSRRFQSQNKLSVFLILSFLLTGILAQAIDSSLRIVWMTIAFAAILFYIYYCDLIQQIDSLTELLNRRIYATRIREEKNRVGILILDINGFKAMNDTYGHQFGDACLATIGKAIKEAYGKAGLCYRIGGDEFCVILDHHIAEADKLNAEFNKILAQKRLKESRLPDVSVGYTIFEPDQMSMDEAIADADQKMYEMKEKAAALSEANTKI